MPERMAECVHTPRPPGRLRRRRSGRRQSWAAAAPVSGGIAPVLSHADRIPRCFGPKPQQDDDAPRLFRTRRLVPWAGGCSLAEVAPVAEAADPAACIGSSGFLACFGRGELWPSVRDRALVPDGAHVCAAPRAAEARI